MNYNETVAYLFSRLPAFHRIGKAAYKGNLDNTIELDRYFNHPHNYFRTVHVAGTNGKGSVSHMLASIFQEAGYKTGLYTSPHLRDFRERIRINGNMIPEKEVIDFVKNHNDIIDRIEPSFFELAVAMAFDFFARMKVDVAIIEVGMGGRLDSTNIISPELSVITNIGHDHMEFLGRTLEAVAGEKAGIIKEGIPVVIGETQPETRQVFESRAKEFHSLIFFADKEYRCSLGEFDYSTCNRPWELKDLKKGTVLKGYTPLGGLSQEKNIQTVAKAYNTLSTVFEFCEENFLKGVENVVKNTGLMGRWQILSTDPLTICDTGHNREGLEYVIKQILLTAKKQVHFVIGFVNDKDLTSVLPLFPSEWIYYFTKASVPRALDEKILMMEAKRYGLTGLSFPTVTEALSAAKRNASSEEMIFIGGSTFVVAEVV